jgi:hypothetical protein
MLKNRLFILIMVMAIPVLARAQAPASEPKSDVPGWIAHVIDAYGGEKAMRAVHGYHAVGSQVATQNDQTAHTDRWFARPDRLRLDLAYPDHTEIRVTSGKDGWSGTAPDHLTAANPMKLQAMRLQTVRLDLPLRLLEQRDKIEAREPDENGRIVLRLPVDNGLYIDYHIDPKTWLITHATTGMSNPAMEFSADYDDFRKVSGVLVPYQELTFAGSTMTSKFKMTSFEWDPKDLESHLVTGKKGSN